MCVCVCVCVCVFASEREREREREVAWAVQRSRLMSVTSDAKIQNCLAFVDVVHFPETCSGNTRRSGRLGLLCSNYCCTDLGKLTSYDCQGSWKGENKAIHSLALDLSRSRSKAVTINAASKPATTVSRASQITIFATNHEVKQTIVDKSEKNEPPVCRQSESHEACFCKYRTGA